MNCDECGVELQPLAARGEDIGDVCLECGTVYLGYGWHVKK